MRGSCKCGSVQFEAGAPLHVVNCHCGLCRRMNGTAFTTYVVFESDRFAISQGAESVATFAATERAQKQFCRRCGTPLFNRNAPAYPGLMMVYLGALDEAAAITPRINIYCANKLGWTDALAMLPAFDDAPRRGA